jgi:hypothetical protein
VRDIGSKGGIRWEDEDARVVSGYAKLHWGAKHPSAHLSPDLPLAYLESSGQTCTHGSERHQVTYSEVARSAHDTFGTTSSRIDFDKGEVFGVGVVRDINHPGDDHAMDLFTALLERLDLGPRVREKLAEFLR